MKVQLRTDISKKALNERLFLTLSNEDGRNDSIRTNGTERPQFDTLLKELQTEVLIIGAKEFFGIEFKKTIFPWKK